MPIPARAKLILQTINSICTQNKRQLFRKAQNSAWKTQWSTCSMYKRSLFEHEIDFREYHATEFLIFISQKILNSNGVENLTTKDWINLEKYRCELTYISPYIITELYTFIASLPGANSKFVKSSLTAQAYDEHFSIDGRFSSVENWHDPLYSNLTSDISEIVITESDQRVKEAVRKGLIPGIKFSKSV